MDESLNVFDEPLEPCGNDPVTGFYRDGCCNTSDDDRGSHTVCVEVTQAFLEFSRFRGNDLMTPASQFGFPGLSAPRVHLTRTHKRALEIVPLEKLKQHAVDIN
jgi:uncharacterized protein (DUF2237 family)